jgi:hypothetical protein
VSVEALDQERGDTEFQVQQWEDELAKETKSALKDMAEVEDKDIEAEATAFTAKLLFLVTDGDWKQAEGIASVLNSFFSEQSNDGEAETSEEEESEDEEETQASEKEDTEASDSDGEDDEDGDDDEGVIVE